MARNPAAVAVNAPGAKAAEGAVAPRAPAAHQANAAQPHRAHPASESLSALGAIPTTVKAIPARTNPQQTAAVHHPRDCTAKQRMPNMLQPRGR
jgi:hypothetical protein